MGIQNIYDSLVKVENLVFETYMSAIIIAIIALGIALLVSKLIPFQGGANDPSYKTRRIWFILIGLISMIAFYLYNSLSLMPNILKAPFQSKFNTGLIISLIIILFIYFGVGLLIMFFFRKSKFGSILG